MDIFHSRERDKIAVVTTPTKSSEDDSAADNAVLRFAPEDATSLANGNQMQPVAMEALSVAQYQVLGCARGANSECLETFVGH